jgi:glycosyltransferase involved in cell wall biosynthesis
MVCLRPPGVMRGVNAVIKSRRLRKLLLEMRSDVIYQRAAEWTTGVCGAVARRTGAVFVHAIASDRDIRVRGSMDGNAWQRVMHRRGMRCADLVFGQHAEQVGWLRTEHGLEGCEFPSVYDAAPPATDAERDTVFWIGSIREIKRPELLLDLARRLPERRFVMIGGPRRGPGAEEFHRGIVEQAASLPNVEFLGFLPPEEIDARLQRAALLVNTSEYEGLPVTFLQAWRQGVPTIGFSSAIRGAFLEQCGWAVGERDTLPETVERLLAQPGEIAARGQRALAYFQENHAVDMAIGRFEALVAERMRNRAGGVSR